MSPRDIAYIAGFSVISGVVFIVISDVVAPIATALGGHLGVAAIYGVWFIGGPLVGYVVRKPGAALLGETIGALIELFLFSPYSIMLYYYGPAQGAMSELVFFLTRYRRWDYKTMAVAGALPAIAAYPFDCLVSPFYPECRVYPLSLHATIFGLMLVSGAFFAGILMKLLVDMVVEAGALKLS